MFSKTEVRELAIAWIILGLCFSFRYLFSAPGLFPQFLVISLIGIGTGFIVHEVTHKLVAQHFGYQAEFRLWRTGLIVALASALLTMGRFLFAAPGAVYILSYTKPREQGIISLSGPVANLVLAAGFYLLALGSGWSGTLGAWGFQINLWLAAFNLLPIPPLDGKAVLSWDTRVWILMVLVAWGGLGLVLLGII